MTDIGLPRIVVRVPATTYCGEYWIKWDYTSRRWVTITALEASNGNL